jgi:hypothetical protein
MPKKDERETTLAAVQSLNDIIISVPDSGFLGRFLQDTENMLKARAMRMGGLLRRINESGQRTENLLRSAAERMEAAAAELAQQFRKQGLASDPEDDADTLIER